MDHITLKNTTNDLHQAYKNFFASVKGKRKGPKVSAPRFKKKSNRQTFRTTCKLENGKIKIPKLKSWIKIIDHCEIKGNIKNVTISKCPSGKYFASIVSEQDIIPKGFTGNEVGLDLGIKDLLITSDGVKFVHPDKITEKTNRLLKQQQKILARKTRGSINYEKQRIKVAKLYERKTNIRNNYYHEISNYLVTNYDAIYMEDLNVSGMLKNRKLSRAIHDAAWSTLSYMLQYKCNWNQRTFHKINRWFPSSKTCSTCGYKHEHLTLTVREWECPSCHTVHDRDINAATNILNEGQLDLYGIKVPKLRGNGEINFPLVLQKLTNKIERSLPNVNVCRGMEQVIYENKLQ